MKHFVKFVDHLLIILLMFNNDVWDITVMMVYMGIINSSIKVTKKVLTAVLMLLENPSDQTVCCNHCSSNWQIKWGGELICKWMLKGASTSNYEKLWEKIWSLCTCAHLHYDRDLKQNQAYAQLYKSNKRQHSSSPECTQSFMHPAPVAEEFLATAWLITWGEKNQQKKSTE